MAAGVPERRSGERRQGERRQAERRRGEGAPPAVGPDTQAADSRFVPREEAGAEAGGGALLRVVRLYTVARAWLGVALLGSQAAAGMAGARAQDLLTALCAAYAAQGLVVWLLPRLRAWTERLAQPAAAAAERHRQWSATIGVDLVVFLALHLLDHSSSYNFAALLVLPVLMTGVLMPRIVALGTAAAVALVLLAGAVEAGLRGGDPTLGLARTGLAGIGFFVIALLAGELAARLVREETAARESLELARQQAQLNRLVIQELAEGVLVIDRGLRVRTANPAGRALLVTQGPGPAAPFGLDDRPGWSALAQAAREALASGPWPGAGREVAIAYEDGQLRTVRLRVRFTSARADDAVHGADPYCVLLLEDLRTAQARLRQEKLAAMGRVSAGIAHEIRNPLAAIAQANALLLEDGLRPDQQRLARMVADNVGRLQRIVDDVMELAPAGSERPPAPIDARAVVATTVVEWAHTNGIDLGPNSRLRVEVPDGALGALFDADHLRRVLVNLLDNAARHAGPEPGAVWLRLAPADERQVVLQVLSDGPAIPPEVERHLFEPFFSTRSRGSGLGLYICRELCERYGASIDYRGRPGAERWRNGFVVTMRRATPATPDAVLPLQA